MIYRGVTLPELGTAGGQTLEAKPVPGAYHEPRNLSEKSLKQDKYLEGV